jgi:phage-related protein
VCTLLKELFWVGSCRKDLRAFPQPVREVMGFALFLAQRGEKHPDAKPLHMFSGAGVLEIVDDFDNESYRTVYTVMFVGRIYVLHAFQKKSKTGIKTRKQDMDLIEQRLRRAREMHADRKG